MSSDIAENIYNKLKLLDITLQVDKPSDISNKAQLLAFVCFICKNELHNFCVAENYQTTQEHIQYFNVLLVS
jgi:hypothetical protein